jgi:predicted RNA-binding Zn-ribbon protein involved in translation (DUF1610 family)
MGEGLGGENDVRLSFNDRIRLRIWQEFARYHRCPECGHRPDLHHNSGAPRWEHDRVAQMLGVAQFGCRRCGNGAITERDAPPTPPEASADE